MENSKILDWAEQNFIGSDQQEDDPTYKVAA